MFFLKICRIFYTFTIFRSKSVHCIGPPFSINVFINTLFRFFFLLHYICCLTTFCSIAFRINSSHYNLQFLVLFFSPYHNTVCMIYIHTVHIIIYIYMYIIQNLLMLVNTGITF